MEKVYLMTSNDSLEAYLIEAILKKNGIESEVEKIESLKKRKYNDLPEKANVFVEKDKYDDAVALLQVVHKERALKEENKEEDRLFSKKQLFFAFTISIVFLLIVIVAVIYSLK